MRTRKSKAPVGRGRPPQREALYGAKYDTALLTWMQPGQVLDRPRGDFPNHGAERGRGNGRMINSNFTAGEQQMRAMPSNLLADASVRTGNLRNHIPGHTVHTSGEEPQFSCKSDKTNLLAMHKDSALKRSGKAPPAQRTAAGLRFPGRGPGREPERLLP
jgi:hypothetical protein